MARTIQNVRSDGGDGMLTFPLRTALPRFVEVMK